MSETPYQPSDRRPIASRSWPIFQWLAGRFVQWHVSANAISVAGMLGAIGGGFAFAATSWAPDWDRLFWLSAATLIQLRLLANLLDGMVAVESGKASPLGELYNDVPDRVSDVAIIVGAGYSTGGDVVLGFWAACIALFTAYVRAAGKVAGAPQEFCGPMAKQQRMFLLTVIAVFNGVAPKEWQPSWDLIAGGLAGIIAGGIVTVLRRLIRIAGNLQRPS